MNKVFPQKIFYELQEKLGEGLTSQVYKAFRVDQAAWTRQLVALKIIKSKKNVQILKREFEKLSRVQSRYCVQVKAWENLPQGSALVLEYIEGVTLDRLQKEGVLTHEFIEEIIGQMNLGLRALHRVQVYHGDLNLKNVLVSRQGLVKLIDFGFFSSAQENWTTPQFASPKLLEGGVPNEKTDEFSLEKIQTYLIKSIGKKVYGPFLSGTRAGRRRSLSTLVTKLLDKDSQRTQVVKVPKVRKVPIRRQGLLVMGASFLLCLLCPDPRGVVTENFGYFQVSGHQWVSFSVNGLPLQFGPQKKKKMRQGAYELRWKTAFEQRVQAMKVQKQQTFLLKPEKNNL